MTLKRQVTQNMSFTKNSTGIIFTYIKYDVFSSLLLKTREDASHCISGGIDIATLLSLPPAQRMGKHVWACSRKLHSLWISKKDMAWAGVGWGERVVLATAVKIVNFRICYFSKNTLTLDQSMKNRVLGNLKSPNEHKFVSSLVAQSSC